VLDGLGRDRMVAAARLRLIAQSVDAGLHEPTPSPRDRLRRQIELLTMSIPLAPAALSNTTRARRTTPADAHGRAITASNFCFCG
jgi:hypothetical protein